MVPGSAAAAARRTDSEAVPKAHPMAPSTRRWRVSRRVSMPGDARHAGADQEVLERARGPPRRRSGRQVADHHATAPRARRLVVEGGDAVVPDVGVGEGDDLAGVARIGDDLLVARQHRVEDQLARWPPRRGRRPRRPRPRTPRRRPARAGPGPGPRTSPRPPTAVTRLASAASSPSSLRLAVDHDGLAPEDGVADPAGQDPSRPRRVAASTGQPGRGRPPTWPRGRSRRCWRERRARWAPRARRPGRGPGRRCGPGATTSGRAPPGPTCPAAVAHPRPGRSPAAPSAPSATGSAVCRPEHPRWGRVQGGVLALGACGARGRWPRRRRCPTRTRRAARTTSASERRGGFTLNTGS